MRVAASRLIFSEDNNLSVTQRPTSNILTEISLTTYFINAKTHHSEKKIILLQKSIHDFYFLFSICTCDTNL